VGLIEFKVALYMLNSSALPDWLDVIIDLGKNLNRVSFKLVAI
jgi:hypothetical protein